MSEEIASFLNSSAIAVVGVSKSKMKFGSLAYRTLKGKGYRVFPVNHGLPAHDGDPCYATLSELPEQVDAVVVTIRPEKAVSIVGEAIRSGVKRMWFQQGADFSALASQAREAGLEVVTDKCLLMYAEPVAGIHRAHRFFAKILKQY